MEKKGFQRRCIACGEFGHAQWECGKASGSKAKGKCGFKGKGDWSQAYNTEYNNDHWNAKGQGKDHAYGKGKSGAFAGKWYGGDVKGCGKGDGNMVATRKSHSH